MQRRPPSVPRRSGLDADDWYEPLDPGNGYPPSGSGARARWSRLRCLTTQGRPFNFVVGLVILANSIIIGLEADLGLLGNDMPGWAGLKEDLDLFGVSTGMEGKVQSSLRKGINMDAQAKDGIQDEVRTQFEKDIDFNRDLQLQQGSTHLRSGAYTLCEYFFVAFFTLEFLCRLCDRSSWQDRWLLFDAAVVVMGIADATLPFFVVDPAASESALILLATLRTLRVLRVFRLFRISTELKAVAWGFAAAFSTVVWTSTVVLIINFVVAALATSLIGQKAYLWDTRAPEVEAWFGSVGRSLQTLFSIMTLSGWEHVAAVLAEVIPGTVVGLFIVVYILLCFFTMLSLVSGIVNASFMNTQKYEEDRRLRAIEDYRGHFAFALTNILEAQDKAMPGHLTKAEYKAVLEGYPQIFTQLRRLDVDTSRDELLQVFDRLNQASQDTTISGVKIDVLVEAVVHLNAVASSSDVFDVKHLLSNLRREAASQSGKLRAEVADQHREAVAKNAAQVADLRKNTTDVLSGMGGVQQHLAIVSLEVDTIKEKLENANVHRELDKAALAATLESKLDAIASQLAHAQRLDEKLDALARQLEARPAEQAKLEAKVEALAKQLAVQEAAHAQESAAPGSQKPGAETGGTPCPPESSTGTESPAAAGAPELLADVCALSGGEPEPDGMQACARESPAAASAAPRED